MFRISTMNWGIGIVLGAIIVLWLFAFGMTYFIEWQDKRMSQMTKMCRDFNQSYIDGYCR